MVLVDRHVQRMVILAEGRLSSAGLRMVIAALLYIPDRVVAVIDSTKDRSTTQELIGFGGAIPVVHSLEEALVYEPDSLLIGIMPLGGHMPDSWRSIVEMALVKGLHVVSALKKNLRQDEYFSRLADEHGARIHDLLHVSKTHQIRAQGSWRKRTVNTILTVGTDSNTGKMTTALMLYREMLRRGISVSLIGTGPTGILISGRGVAVEAVTSDFLEGAIEFEVDKAVNDGVEYVIVEGQSAITNSGNAAIAMGLLHGAMPDAMILCHQPSRLIDGYGLPLPSVATVRDLHESLMRVYKPSQVVGIGLNSMDLSTEELRSVAGDLQHEHGLPVLDPMREHPGPLVDAILTFFSSYQHVLPPDLGTGILDRVH
jgi:uncharacterized NAD-dependent epimerase/dehydratase family protein